MLNIVIIFCAVALFWGAFQFKKEGASITFGRNFGFAENLNWKGRFLFFAGLVWLFIGISLTMSLF